MEPRVVEITPEQYHRDEGTTPDGRPTLSRSAAVRLLESSPMHVWHDHPRLGGAGEESAPAEHLDIGQAVHALLLRDTLEVDVLRFPDYRTNAAKAARDDSRNAGRIPMLAHKWEPIEAAIGTIRERIAEIGLTPAPFTDGLPERVIVWDEPTELGPVTCRAMLDWLRHDLAVIDDLKTTPTGLANPREWARRRMFEHGGDVQAAWYTRAAEALGARRPKFRFLVIETSPPYGVSVVLPDEFVLEVGAQKMDLALFRWRQSIDSGKWPGYGAYEASVPPWIESQWLDLRLDESRKREGGRK